MNLPRWLSQLWLLARNWIVHNFNVAVIRNREAVRCWVIGRVFSSVANTVVDQTREVIPGASVTLVSELTADVRATATNEAGGGCSFGGRSITSSNATRFATVDSTAQFDAAGTRSTGGSAR